MEQMNGPAEAPLEEYGVVFLHVTEDIYEDLVGPTYPSLSDASEAYLKAKRAGGYRGTMVQRQADGSWRTIYSRQTPKEWQRSTLEREAS